MRKAGKRVEETAVETQDVSSPKKTKLKEKKVKKDSTEVAVASERLPRAAKTRAAAQTNGNVEINAEPKKSRARTTKATLRRSNSSGDIESLGQNGKLKKGKSRSAEDLNKNKVPATKKTKNVTTKTTKKTAAKKATNEGKPKSKTDEDNIPDGSDDELEVERPLLIPKKAYGRGMPKKVVPVETKDNEEPEEKMVAKDAAPTKKPARGRGKAAPIQDVGEDNPIGETKPAKKGKRGKANAKETVPALEENVKDISKEAQEDAEEAVKQKRGGKRGGTSATKAPRGKKIIEAGEKDVGEDNENLVSEMEVSKEKAKPTKGAMKRKAPTVRNRGKKATGAQNEDDPEDPEDDNDKNVNGSHHEQQNVAEKKNLSMKNGKANSFDSDDNNDGRNSR